MSGPARTLYRKIWDAHVIEARDDGSFLMYIDRHLINEGSSVPAFVKLKEAGRPVRRPDAHLAVADHLVPTTARCGGELPPQVRALVEQLERNCADNGIPHITFQDKRQGICHVVGPEQGFCQPGMTMVCGDSHTATLGAFGALAFGIGTSEVEHVLSTGALVQWPAKTLRVTLEGRLSKGVGAKDCIMAIIGHIGTAGATGHVIEYAGEVVEGFTMEQRMTLCNMSIEAGAKAGLVAPDETTIAYLRDRPMAPYGKQWDLAAAHWRTLASDSGTVFDREVRIDVSDLAPQVTWGTSPQDVLDIGGAVPDPEAEADPGRADAMRRALAYMGLVPGTALASLPINCVFIGSCTNSRLSDLRAAAAVVRGRRVAPGVRAIVVPGSGLVKAAAEEDGLDRIFLDAGFEWRSPGCSMCCGAADQAAPGERVASTSNRNFENRQGRGARTHLLSPEMAVAAALSGHLCDVRELI